VAEIVGVSRQNMRKLVLAHIHSFPAPMHEGSTSLWHLADVLAWLLARGSYTIGQETLDLARVAMAVNVSSAHARLVKGSTAFAH